MNKLQEVFHDPFFKEAVKYYPHFCDRKLVEKTKVILPKPVIHTFDPRQVKTA